jgi:SWI/SNF-related matrix-associated actin-dependent regulator 1 of chromatin subfamily A
MKLTHNGRRYVAQSTFDERAIPKTAGFRWDPASREWWTSDDARAARLVQYADHATRARLAARAESRVASRATDAAIEIPAPEGLDYLPYQRAGIAYALARPATILADEMGLGKTIQAIGMINASPAGRALIICPAHLRLNWGAELDRWIVHQLPIARLNGAAPSIDSGPAIYIASYECAVKHAVELSRVEWDALIIDEAHYLKNPKAKRTRSILGGGRGETAMPGIRARRRIFLSGTPMLNRPVELWPLLHAVDPDRWRSWKYFVLRYCAAQKTRYGWDVSGASHLDDLQDLMRSTVMIRRLKHDVLAELPAKRRQIIELPADGLSLAHESEAREWLAAARESDLLDASEYRRVAGALGAGKADAFADLSAARHRTAIAKLPMVIEHIRDLLDGGLVKLVVFAWHRDVVDGILDALADGFACVRATGDDSHEERHAAAAAFQTDPNIRVIACTIAAMGTGVTLTAASHVLFAELDWVPANLTQCEDRLHRIGQLNAVTIQHLVVSGSIDAEMAVRVVAKQRVADLALDVLPTLPALPDSPASPTAPEPEISVEERARILEHLRYLARRCDHADRLDGMGFNRLDAAFGHALAEQQTLSARQAIAAQRMLRKYERQLRARIG